MATPGHAHKEQLAKEALLVSHKPAVLYQGLWVRYVSALGLDPKAFASQHMEDLLGQGRTNLHTYVLFAVLYSHTQMNANINIGDQEKKNLL